MPSGIVKFFNDEKGYGFIIQDQGGDIFVHVKDLRETGLQTLSSGQTVTFDVSVRHGKTQAVNVLAADKTAGNRGERRHAAPAGAGGHFSGFLR